MDFRVLSDDELLALSREINLELLRRVPVKVETPTVETPAPFVGRCPDCRGTGYRMDNGEFCTCGMGRDVQRVEGRAGGLSRFAPAEAKYAGPEPEWAEEDEPDEPN